jgi:hypothetical protein
MQARRTAIILPLGLLLDSVEANPFITTILGKAKSANPNFVFTPELQAKTFSLADQYNKNTISILVFKSELLESLGITDMEMAEFLAAWNQIIKVGDVAGKVSPLKALLERENAILFLVSDTNVEHLMAIESSCPDLLLVKGSENLQKFAEFPLYTSCHYGKNRTALIQLVVGEIEKLTFKKPNDIKVVLGDPKNVANPSQRVIVEAQCEEIKTWGAQKNVEVVLHNKDNQVVATLGQIFKPVVEVERKVSTMSMS